MAQNRITTVIFDMGGVLLRTVDPAPREAIAKRFGVTRRELEAFVFSSETSILSEEGKLSDVTHWQTVMRHFGQPASDHIQLYDEYFAGDAIDQRLLAFAASLKPKYKLGLLSNAWENVRPLLRARFDFIDTFDESIFSYEVRARKPDAAMYQAILNLMDVPPEEAVFIDDVLENVEGAQAVGIQALHFSGTETLISTLSDLLAHVA